MDPKIQALIDDAKKSGGAALSKPPQAKNPALDEPTNRRIEDLRKSNSKLSTVVINDDRSVLYDYLKSLLRYGMDSQQIENCMASFKEFAKDYIIYKKVTE